MMENSFDDISKKIIGAPFKKYRRPLDKSHLTAEAIKEESDIRELLNFYRALGTGETSLLHEKKRLVKIQADRREVDLRREMGQLVDAEAVRKEYFGRARAVRDGVLNMFDRIDPLLAAEQDRKKRYQIFTKEVSHILKELAVGDLPVKRKARRK